MPRPRSSVIDHAYAMDLRARRTRRMRTINNGTLEGGSAFIIACRIAGYLP